MEMVLRFLLPSLSFKSIIAWTDFSSNVTLAFYFIFSSGAYSVELRTFCVSRQRVIWHRFTPSHVLKMSIFRLGPSPITWVSPRRGTSMWSWGRRVAPLASAGDATRSAVRRLICGSWARAGSEQLREKQKYQLIPTETWGQLSNETNGYFIPAFPLPVHSCSKNWFILKKIYLSDFV